MTDSCGSDTNGHLYQTNLIANQAILGSSGGVLTTLATANNAMFGTNGSGVPSITQNPRMTSITFDGTNLLNTYTIGTWTPEIRGNSTLGSITYTTQVGNYIKIGKLVLAQFYVTYTANTGTGSLILNSLPFALANEVHGPAWFSGTQAWGAGRTAFDFYGASGFGTLKAFFTSYGSAVTSNNPNITNTTSTYVGTLLYQASS